MEFPKASREYAHLKSFSENWGLTYGPLQSRRVGLSLGVNLLGSQEKVCSFNCPYCELGETTSRLNKSKKETDFPSLEEIDLALRTHLKKIYLLPNKIDSISLVGNGEPTLYPQFAEALALITKARDEIISQAKITVFTNATTFDNRKIAAALNTTDQVMVKLDAGNENMLKKINAPLVRMTIAKLIENIKAIENPILQSCFVQGVIDNTTQQQVDEWIEVIGLLQPKLVHVYTLDRVPAISGLKKVDEDTLDIIAQKLSKRIHCRVLTFP